MTSRELVLERIAELSPEDLDAVNEYLDRLQDAGDDPVRKAFLRASLLPPEKLSPEDRAAIDEALAEDIYYSRDELSRLLEAEDSPAWRGTDESAIRPYQTEERTLW